MRDFKKLLVWQRAYALSIAVHDAVHGIRRGSEHTERKSQLTRAADSIVSNIVEGCGAATQKAFARHLDISITSTTETEYHLLAARDRAALPADLWQPLTSEAIEVRRMTHGLHKKVLADAKSARTRRS
jgi:four helix bundle protein